MLKLFFFAPDHFPIKIIENDQFPFELWPFHWFDWWHFGYSLFERFVCARILKSGFFVQEKERVFVVQVSLRASSRALIENDR